MVNICNRVYCHWQYTTSAWNSCTREVRFGPTWSIGWLHQAQESTTIVLLTFVSYSMYLLLLGRYLGSIGWFLAICLSISTMYPWHECLMVMRSIHVPVLDSVAVGDMVDEFCIPKRVTPKKRQKVLMGPWKGFTPKFRACRLRMTSPWKLIFTKSQTSNWPRFLVVSSTVEGALKKLSPFAIQKAIVGLAFEPKSV